MKKLQQRRRIQNASDRELVFVSENEMLKPIVLKNGSRIEEVQFDISRDQGLEVVSDLSDNSKVRVTIRKIGPENSRGKQVLFKRIRFDGEKETESMLYFSILLDEERKSSQD